MVTRREGCRARDVWRAYAWYSTRGERGPSSKPLAVRGTPLGIGMGRGWFMERLKAFPSGFEAVGGFGSGERKTFGCAEAHI